jgi:hypothetical protein
MQERRGLVSFSSMSASNYYLKQFVPALRPHCHQITGIVGAVSRRRGVRNGTFHDYRLFLIEAVGTENVSFPKPAGFALCPLDRSHRPSKLLLAIHPSAQLLGFVVENEPDLIFVTVIVRHLFSP